MARGPVGPSTTKTYVHTSSEITDLFHDHNRFRELIRVHCHYTEQALGTLVPV